VEEKQTSKLAGKLGAHAREEEKAILKNALLGGICASTTRFLLSVFYCLNP